MQTLAHLTEEWWRHTADGGTVTTVMLDVAKAFDRVDRSLLLYKLSRHAGIHGPLLAFLRSFLTASSQRVKLEDGTLSDPLANDRGTPQGSCLSPVLWLIWINDLPLGLETNVSIFADDTSLWTADGTAAEQQAALTRDLAGVDEWASLWGVEFGPAKSRHMELSRTKGGKTTGTVTFRGQVVPRAKTFTLLGMVISDDLKWDAHLEQKD